MDNTIVITKCIGGTINGDAKHTKFVTDALVEFGSNFEGDKFGAKGRGFNCILGLGEPADWAAINEDNDASGGTSS